MSTRSTPTANTPATSSGKICLTKRQDSHNQSRSSSSAIRVRASQASASSAASTPTKRPVMPMPSPDALASMRNAANSSVAAIERKGDAGPAVEAFLDALEAAPGRVAHGHQQRDQHRALDRHALLAVAGVERHQTLERTTAASAAPRSGRSRLTQASVRNAELQRSCQQQRHPQQHEGQRPRGRARARACAANSSVGRVVVRGVVVVEQQRHDETDADAEREREQQARDREVGTDDVAGVDQREDVAGRREEQERHRRADARALAVDARRTAARSCTSTRPAAIPRVPRRDTTRSSACRGRGSA